MATTMKDSKHDEGGVDNETVATVVSKSNDDDADDAVVLTFNGWVDMRKANLDRRLEVLQEAETQPQIEKAQKVLAAREAEERRRKGQSQCAKMCCRKQSSQLEEGSNFGDDSGSGGAVVESMRMGRRSSSVAAVWRATALWFLLLSGFRDENTSYRTTTAAFTTQSSSRRNAKFSSDPDKRQRRPFSNEEQNKQTNLASTTTAFQPRPKEQTQPTVSSVTHLQVPCSHEATGKNPWEKLVPPIKLIGLDDNAKPGQRLDVTVSWDLGDDLSLAVRSMLERSPATIKTKEEKAMVNHLEQCMHEFQSFCKEHLQVIIPGEQPQHERSENSIQGFRARIVATRGPSGTKCPRWHIDHVPVRWIQSLVGPGCDYVECTNESAAEDEWDRMQYHLEREEHDKVISIPGPSHLQVVKAPEQEVALLVGNRWNEFVQEQESQRFVPPVLHKSPEIPFWQGRVLLTMDVIVPHRHDDD